MLLDKDENIILGKLIGLLNGLDEFIVDDTLKDGVSFILHCLKDQKDYDLAIKEVIELKAKYLSNCLVCASPCGRTNDYSLNAIENEKLKDERIKEYHEFINTFDDSIDFNDIIYHITKLSW